MEHRQSVLLGIRAGSTVAAPPHYEEQVQRERRLYVTRDPSSGAIGRARPLLFCLPFCLPTFANGITKTATASRAAVASPAVFCALCALRILHANRGMCEALRCKLVGAAGRALLRAKARAADRPPAYPSLGATVDVPAHNNEARVHWERSGFAVPAHVQSLSL